jgi:hypothetical protein
LEENLKIYNMENSKKFNWKYDYITEVPPIMMRDSLIELIGQTDEAIPYYYEEAVKIAGHSCTVVAAAWNVTRLALENLYHNGEIPKRGQIKVQMPGAEDEWNIGVFAEVISFVTGACADAGFSGSIFAKGDPLTIRRNKMIFTDEVMGTPPPMMKWIFTRIDTGESVSVSWNIKLVQPPINENDLKEFGHKVSSRTATPEEKELFINNWNNAALFVLNNSVDGLFTVENLGKE